MRSGQHGGETALVLYALLHAGQSLKDDPEFGPKLDYRGKELAPAVDWLTSLTPQETYTAPCGSAIRHRSENSQKVAMKRLCGIYATRLWPAITCLD